MTNTHRISALAIAFALTIAAKDFQRSVPLSAKGRVSVDNYKGLIRITTWDQPNIDVHAHIEADGTNISTRDQEMVEATDIEFDASADSVRIKTRYPKQHGGLFENVSLPLVRYTIRMPRTAELRVKDYKSEIDIDGVNARLDLETYKGTIGVRHHSGELNVKSYKSEARIDFARYTDRSSFETYRGTYNISMPRDAKFDVSSDVGRRGTLHTSFHMMLPAGSSSDSHSLRASVNGGGPTMQLKGYRGEFNIR